MKKNALAIALLLINLSAMASLPHIHLNGSFYEMGRQYTAINGERILKQLDLFKSDLRLTDPIQEANFEKFVKLFLHVTIKRYPLKTLDFIKGESDSDFAKLHHLSFDDFLKLDQQMVLALMAFEFKHNDFKTPYEACSFIGVKDTNPIVGRNFDYPKDFTRLFNTYAEILSIKHSDETTYPNTVYMLTWPGAITQATFVTNNGLYASINIGANVDARFHIVKRPSFPLLLLTNMMQSRQFTDLKSGLLHTPVDAGYIVNIAGPNHDELLSMEASPYNELQGHYTPNNIPTTVFINRLRSPESHNTIDPEIDSNPNFIVSTNTFRLSGWEQYLGHDVDHQHPGTSNNRYRNLYALLHYYERPDLFLMRDIISRRLHESEQMPGALRDLCPIDSETSGDYGATYYSVVFDPALHSFDVRLQNTTWTPLDKTVPCNSSWSSWHHVDVS